MRNPSIDIYKFFFSLMIAIFHFYGRSTPREHFPLGGVIVEFFVLASGVFFYSKWERVKQKNKITELYPYEYAKKRFLRFFPYNLAGVIFAFLVRRIYLYQADGGVVTIGKIVRWLSSDIWEIILIKMNGLNKNAGLLNAPAWTISAMFIVEFVIVCLLVNREKLFYTVICPISILVGYGFWRHVENGGNEIWIGFTTFGVLRVFLVMCLAWYCYQLAEFIKKAQYTQKGIWILTFCEVICYCSVLLIVMYGTTRNFKWVATGFLLFAVSLSASQKTYIYTLSMKLNHTFTSWLGRLSVDIYLAHGTIIYLFTHFYPDKYDMYRQKFIYMLLCLAVAIIFECLVVLGQKICIKAFHSLKLQMLEGD